MTEGAYLERACPACGADAPRDEVHSAQRAEDLSFEALRPYWAGLFKEKVFFSYQRCTRCALLYAPRYYTNEQLGELYADMAPNMELVPGDALEATQGGYWDVTRRSAPMDGGYLEIGPDIGWVAKHAASEGRYDHFWLFEPNLSVHAQLAAAVGDKAHSISTAMDDLSIVPDASVGLAVMVHVLDHLLDPIASLKRIHAKLKPGGMLMIVTHNERSVLRTIMSTRWPPFCLQHPELYNPDSMKDLVGRAGYSAVEVQRSKNYFPIKFIAQQAAYTVGVKLDKVPLPSAAIGLKLGNMITLARR